MRGCPSPLVATKISASRHLRDEAGTGERPLSLVSYQHDSLRGEDSPFPIRHGRMFYTLAQNSTTQTARIRQFVSAFARSFVTVHDSALS
jgi:hypothetical protein